MWCNVELTYKKGRNDIAKHAASKTHKTNVLTPRNTTPAISEFLSEDSSATVLETEARIASFLIQHDLPFSIADSLVPFLQTLPHQNVLKKVRLGKQKAVNFVRQGLGPYFKQRLLNELKIRTFSIVIDETTDVGTTKQLAICVTFCNNELDNEADVLDFVECSSGTAVSLFSKLKETLDFLEKNQVLCKIGLVSAPTQQTQ